MEKSETISPTDQDASPAVGSRASTGGSFGALRHASFRNLWIGLLVSNFGTWAQNVAQGWLLYQLSDSRLMLGLLGLSFALPMIAIPLFGGVIADRFNRLSVLRCTQALAMIMGAILSWLTFAGRITVWHIIGLSFLRAVVLAVDNPTRQALIPALIPREDMASAMALNGIIFTGAGLVGSAIAGLILHGYEGRVFEGSAVVFALNTISYAAVLAPLFMMRLPIRTSQEGSERRSAAQELRDGFAYLRSRPVLGLLVSLSAIVNLFGRSFPQLMPVLARDVLHVGAGGLGTMYSLASAGALIGGFGLAAAGKVRRQRAILAWSLLLMTASILMLALSRWYLASLVILVINGIVTAMMTATIATCIQTNVEERMRGRIMSYYTLTIIGLPPMGGAIAGAIAEWLPVECAVILPAVVLIFLFWGAVLYAPAWHKLQ